MWTDGSPGPAELRHGFVSANGIRMHYTEAGSGAPVVFLHGFPESWYSWRHQLAALADHYRVIAPDQRGYNETESRGPFDIETLQRDVIGLAEALGEDSVHVVGHDWGGAVAWMLALNHPRFVRSLSVLNLPHPALFARGLRRPRQALRSWYILFFQLPVLPERVLAIDSYRRLARSIIRQSAPGTFTREDVSMMLAGWRRQGLGGGLEWYRAALRHPLKAGSPVPVVECPTLVAWGENDRYLGRELTEGTERLVKDLRMEYLPGVSHWVQQEAPNEINRMLREHLARATVHGT